MLTSLKLSIRKATYSERQSWVSVCWPRKIKNRSSSVGAHYSTDKQMSKRFTMISYAGRCQANTRCISKYISKESLAQLANLVFFEFLDVWVKFADEFIHIDFIKISGLFPNWRWFCIAEDGTKKGEVRVVRYTVLALLFMMWWYRGSGDFLQASFAIFYNTY